MPEPDNHAHNASESHPVEPVRTYLLVFLALLCLTAGNASESYFNLGRFNIVAAMGISTTKTLLVAWFFMHVRHASRMTRLVVSSGLLWLGILLILSMSDFATRGWVGVPGH